MQLECLAQRQNATLSETSKRVTDSASLTRQHLAWRFTRRPACASDSCATARERHRVVNSGMSAVSSSKKRAGDVFSDGHDVKKVKYTLNTTMPPDLDFIEPAASGSMRFMTWNVNVAPKGRPVNPDFIRYCKKENADVVCLTEIRSCPDTVLADTYRVSLLVRSACSAYVAEYRYFARHPDGNVST
jgi:hypothetical protein